MARSCTGFPFCVLKQARSMLVNTFSNCNLITSRHLYCSVPLFSGVAVN